MRQGLIGKTAAAVAIGGLIAGSAAQAAPIRATSVDPLVAVSLFGTQGSRASLCAGSASSVAAAGAVAAQSGGATQGCVLPMVDAAPTAQPAPASAMPYAAAPGTGTAMGALPLLLGLAAIAAGVLLLVGKGGDDIIRIPTSPN